MADGFAERWNEVTLAGVRWLVRPEWQARLLNEAGLRWADWQAESRIELVKQAPHRSVFRIALAEGAVFVKHYPTGQWRARLRQMVRPPKARLEWRRTLAASALELPTVEPIAVGERADAESYLITAEWPDAEPLDRSLLRQAEAWARSYASQVRRRFARRLGHFIARLHEAGLRHHDLHAGNLMVRETDAGDDWELTLIDLYAVRLGPPLGLDESLKNLALFGNWFWPRSTPSDRLRFWGAYLRARRTLRLDKEAAKAAAAELEEATWRRHRHVWLDRSRRCLGANREFRRLKAPGMVGQAVVGWPESCLDAWLQAPEAPLASVRATVLKASASSQVVKLPVDGADLAYKRFAVVKRFERWTQAWAGSPARRSWHAAFMLLDAGVPTPRPVAFFEQRGLGWVGDSYLVAEHLNGAVPLADHVRGLDRLPPARRREGRRRLAGRAAHLLRRLHRYGLSHRDLKAANWLVVPARAVAGDDRLYLIDLVGVTRQRRLADKRRAKDLARFALSFLAESTRTERLRFLQSYLGSAAADWRRWWREIERFAAAKSARNRRRGRPLT